MMKKFDKAEMPARQDWMTDRIYELVCMEAQARANTLQQKECGRPKKALVAIKAQHPLNSDGSPGVEYERRLKKALEVAYMLQNQGFFVHFATFGGIHVGNDSVTLAEAGRDFLKAHDKVLRDSQIHVFPEAMSGNDEDRLATECLEKGEYNELHVVMSDGQYPRARLSFITLGLYPEFHPVVMLDETPHHSFVCELYGHWAVPAFAKSTEEVQRATGEIAQKHLDEIREVEAAPGLGFGGRASTERMTQQSKSN